MFWKKEPQVPTWMYKQLERKLQYLAEAQVKNLDQLERQKQILRKSSTILPPLTVLLNFLREKEYYHQSELIRFSNDEKDNRIVFHIEIRNNQVNGYNSSLGSRGLYTEWLDYTANPVNLYSTDPIDPEILLRQLQDQLLIPEEFKTPEEESEDLS